MITLIPRKPFATFYPSSAPKVNRPFAMALLVSSMIIRLVMATLLKKILSSPLPPYKSKTFALIIYGTLTTSNLCVTFLVAQQGIGLSQHDVVRQFHVKIKVGFDIHVWKHNNNGTFSTKYAWNLFWKHNPHLFLATFIWIKVLSIKIAVFV